MALVSVVQCNSSFRPVLRRGLSRKRFRVRACSSLDRLHTLAGEELLDAVVINVRAVGAGGAFAFAALYPGIPVFAYGAFRPDDGELLSACFGAGLRGILIEGVDDSAVGEIVAAHSASSVRRDQLRDAPRLLRLSEPVQLSAWEEALAGVGERTRTSDIARSLGMTREHLSREFAAGGAPNLKRVIDLAKLTCAGDLLANPGYRVTTVARVLRYASASHLAGSAHRIAGVTPRELARLGPREVLGRFLRGRTRSRL